MNDTTRNSRPRIPRTIGDDDERRHARNTLIAWRRSMDAQFRRAADTAIAARLEAWLAARPTPEREVLGVYWPVRGEPDLREAMAAWHRVGRRVALPRVPQGGGALEFGRWTPAATMRIAEFGIALPEPFDVLSPTLLVVPCVAFDSRGYRLGYGGGYFDRTLASCQPRPLAIGIGFELCRVDSIHPEAHDIPIDVLVTENSIESYG